MRGEILALASQPHEDPAAFEATAEKIRTLFARNEIPEDVVQEIRTAYQRLANADAVAVAVRSWATAEDLPERASPVSRRPT